MIDKKSEEVDALNKIAQALFAISDSLDKVAEAIEAGASVT